MMANTSGRVVIARPQTSLPWYWRTLIAGCANPWTVKAPAPRLSCSSIGHGVMALHRPSVLLSESPSTVMTVAPGVATWSCSSAGSLTQHRCCWPCSIWRMPCHIAAAMPADPGEARPVVQTYDLAGV